MKTIILLIIDILKIWLKLLRAGGVKALIAENISLRQQLITVSRTMQRAPNLKTFDRFLHGLLVFLIKPKRLSKIAAIIKPLDSDTPPEIGG